MVIELTAEQAYKVCDADKIGCDSSQELSSLETIVGQDRAIRAMQFGLGNKEKGFNIFVSGMPGTGRTTAVRRFLEEVAITKPVPMDWCYVHNFQDPYHPHALHVPAGRAAELQKGMENLTKQVFQEVRNVFESEEYAKHKEETLTKFEQQKQAILEQVNKLANDENFMLQPTPMGVMTVPTRNSKPLSEEDFINLSQIEKEELLKKQQKIQNALETSVRQTKSLDKEAREAVDKLDREIALYALRPWNEDMKEKFKDQPDILLYFDAVQADLLDQVELFKIDGQEETPTVPFAAPLTDGIFEPDSINARVDQRLHEMADALQHFGKDEDAESRDEHAMNHPRGDKRPREGDNSEEDDNPNDAG